MSLTSKFISLKEYIPTGSPKLSHFALNTKEIKLESDNDVLVKNKWISVDPYMRARMTERKNYIPPFELQQPMEGAAIGKVLDSNSSHYSVGDVVVSNYGWRDNYIAEETTLQKIEPINVPLQIYLGTLGMTGHTAYIGLFRIGELKENQTVLVSAAGGSVGSTVCQIAKIKGCKVIASTGSDEKVEWLKNELGSRSCF